MKSAGPLLPTAVGPVLDWIEDETLYSWAAGYHFSSGRTSCCDTAKLLFGRLQSYRPSDVPAGLNWFCEVTGQLLGDSGEILKKRTALEEWWPFLPEQRRTHLVARVSRSEDSSLRMCAGIVSTGLGSSRPMKFCVDCALLHQERFGRTVWRASHQRAATLVCLEHARELRIADLSVAERWQLPNLNARLLPSTLSRAQASTARRLSLVAAAFPEATLASDRALLRRITRQQLVASGIATGVGRINPEALRQWFQRTRTCELVERLSRSFPNAFAGNWPWATLNSRIAAAPLRWHLIWNAILEDIDERQLHATVVAALKLDPDQFTGQGNLWPELPHSDVFEEVRKAFERGATTVQVAQELQVLHWVVKRWVREHPKLKLSLSTAKAQKLLELHVANCHRFLDRNPNATRTQFRRSCCNPVRWLELNGPVHLEKIMGRIPEHLGGHSLLL